MSETSSAINEQASTLLKALDKLPGYHGITYRGHQPDQPGPGRGTTISAGLVATSKDPRVATDNFAVAEVFAIIGNLGRDISTLSQHPEEQEVVFLPGTMFLPIENFTVGDTSVTFIEQLDPDRDRDLPPEHTKEEVHDAMVAAIETAQVHVSVDGVTPGKFVGGLG